jgi:hypothetical protein
MRGPLSALLPLLPLTLAACDATMQVSFEADGQQLRSAEEDPGDELRPHDEMSAVETVQVEDLMLEAPPVEAIQLEVLAIEAHVDDEWITLVEDDAMIDLLVYDDPEDDEAASLDDVFATPGHYNQVRLILGDDNAVVVDGESHWLRIPSGEQSGLKIPLNEDVDAGQSYDLTLAFEIERNLVLNAQGWRLKPVVHVESFEEVPPPEDMPEE